MIYLDTSVAIAQLLAEDRVPPAEIWAGEVISSRLLEYELWNAVHRRRIEATHGEPARRLMESIAFAEPSREVLRRATEPFPTPVRTLDALHLATLIFLREQGLPIRLASYDRKMVDAAAALALPLVEM